jgi:glycosyltransferase involved in cell wall biosynthesis
VVDPAHERPVRAGAGGDMSERRRVLQITVCKFPPEIRVLKEARTLRDAGYDSAVLCPPLAGRPDTETWNGIRIFRPAVLRSAASAADKVLFQSLFFSPAWWRAVREVVREFQPHVLHVHDIWLARSVFAAANGQRIVTDLHENMPAAVEEYAKAYAGAFRLFHKIFKTRPRVLRYERSVLRRSDRALVTVQEGGARVLEEHPALPRERVVVVENLENKDFANGAAATPPPAPNDSPSVLYVGGFGPHRGIDTLIRAMAYLREWKVDVRLDLVGATRGSNYVRMLHELIRELDIASHVHVVEWVPSDSVPELIRRATIGAVPHHSNPHTDSTIPHKLYQYMIVSTPVLVSTSAPLARTVMAARAGAVFRAGDPQDCAEKIRQLLADPGARERLATAGHDYVMRAGHNWEDEAGPILLRAYEGLFGDGARPQAVR